MRDAVANMKALLQVSAFRVRFAFIDEARAIFGVSRPGKTLTSKFLCIICCQGFTYCAVLVIFAEI